MPRPPGHSPACFVCAGWWLDGLWLDGLWLDGLCRRCPLTRAAVLQRRDKAIAFARDGPNDATVAAAVCQSLSQTEYGLVDVIVFHDEAWPDTFHEFFLGKYLAFATN